MLQINIVLVERGAFLSLPLPFVQPQIHFSPPTIFFVKGWRTWLERVLQGTLYGPAERDFSYIIGRKALAEALEEFKNRPKYQRLVVPFEVRGVERRTIHPDVDAHSHWRVIRLVRRQSGRRPLFPFFAFLAVHDVSTLRLQSCI